MALSPETNTTLAEIVALVEANESFVIASHYRPDGDALGSALGLAFSLKAMGKDVRVLNRDGAPESLAFLPGIPEIEVPMKGARYDADVFISLYTAEKDRLGETVASAVNVSVTVNIDHHISNPGYGDLNYIDPTAPATGQIIFQLIDRGKFPLSKEICDLLFVAISTDTGSFQYRSTTADTYRIGASLIEGGVDVAAVSTKLYDSFPLRRVELMRELLAKMKISSGARIASWMLTREARLRLGIKPGDTEGLVDILRGIDSVVVAAHLEEQPDGLVRVSLRSKSTDADVCKICQTFGGGGHQMASGASLPGPPEAAHDRVVIAIEAALPTK